MTCFNACESSLTSCAQDIHLDSLDIVGLPRLSFRRDETVHDYIIYMHAYVNNLSNERIGLGQAKPVKPF